VSFLRLQNIWKNIIQRNIPNKPSIFLREQFYPAKVSRLPSSPSRGAGNNFEILNRNPYFLLHILVDYLESFPKHYNYLFVKYLLSYDA